MVHPQAYDPDYGLRCAPFDEDSNFERVIEVVGEIPPGDVVLAVPDDDGTALVERRFSRREALRRRLNLTAKTYEPNFWDARRPTSKQPLAAGNQREHQPAAPPILPEGHRPLGAQPGRTRRRGAGAQ